MTDTENRDNVSRGKKASVEKPDMTSAESRSYRPSLEASGGTDSAPNQTEPQRKESRTVSEFIISECGQALQELVSHGDEIRSTPNRVRPTSRRWFKVLLAPAVIGIATVLAIRFLDFPESFLREKEKVDELLPHQQLAKNDSPHTGESILTPSSDARNDAPNQTVVERSVSGNEVSSDKLNSDQSDQAALYIRQTKLSPSVVEAGKPEVAPVDKKASTIELGRYATDTSEDRSGEQSREFADLLTSADNHLVNLRFTTPKGRNAFEIYQSILTRDPGNQIAKRGIERISARYLKMGGKAETQGKLDSARGYYSRAAEISPTLLVSVQKELDRLGELEQHRIEAQRLFEVAQKAMNAGDLKQAKTHLDESIKVSPDLTHHSLARQRLVKLVAEKFRQNDIESGLKSKKIQTSKFPTIFRDKLVDKSLGPEMVLIKAGSFRMGDIQGGGDSDEKPVLRVKIGKSFALGKYEITFDEYDRFVQSTGQRRPNDNGWGRGNRPVIDISWKEAKAYTQWLGKQTKKSYRLPNEAEWEYAARAGTKTRYWWGNAASHSYANYGKDVCCDGWKKGDDAWVYTAPVGSFPPNPFGLHEMEGNVWEWTISPYRNSHQSETGGLLANKTSARVARGGAWNLIPQGIRSAYRSGFTPNYRNNAHGFRVARDIE